MLFFSLGKGGGSSPQVCVCGGWPNTTEIKKIQEEINKKFVFLPIFLPNLEAAWFELGGLPKRQRRGNKLGKVGENPKKFCF